MNNPIAATLSKELETRKSEYRMLMYLLGILPRDEAERLKREIETDDATFQLFEKTKSLQNTPFAETVLRKTAKDRYRTALVSEMLQLHLGLLPPDREEELRNHALEDDAYSEAYETATELSLEFDEALRDELRHSLDAKESGPTAFDTALQTPMVASAATMPRVQTPATQAKATWRWRHAIVPCVLLFIVGFYGIIQHQGIHPDGMFNGGEKNAGSGQSSGVGLSDRISFSVLKNMDDKSLTIINKSRNELRFAILAKKADDTSMAFDGVVLRPLEMSKDSVAVKAGGESVLFFNEPPGIIVVLAYAPDDGSNAKLHTDHLDDLLKSDKVIIYDDLQNKKYFSTKIIDWTK